MGLGLPAKYKLSIVNENGLTCINLLERRLLFWYKRTETFCAYEEYSVLGLKTFIENLKDRGINV